jgi:sRNA-binding regulator protein Hfq
MAMGNKYKLEYYVRKKGDAVVIRVAIYVNNGFQNNVSVQEYKSFWNSFGKARFADLIELSPKELF